MKTYNYLLKYTIRKYKFHSNVVINNSNNNIKSKINKRVKPAVLPGDFLKEIFKVTPNLCFTKHNDRNSIKIVYYLV